MDIIRTIWHLLHRPCGADNIVMKLPTNRLLRMWCGIVCCNVSVVTASLAQYTYTTSNGTVTITGYSGPGGAVTIPDTLGGFPVTRIQDLAFLSCTNLTDVIIGSSVTNIGSWPFYPSWVLTNITVNTSNALYSSIAGVLFNKTQTILVQYPRGRVGSYSIPNGVTNIGDSAFSLATNLPSMIIPAGVTRIEGGAFWYCINLTNVAISTSVTSIGDFGFGSNASLSVISIPSSVTNIGYFALNACLSLTSIVVEAGNPAFSSEVGVLFDKTKVTLIQCPGGKQGAYAIPNGVTDVVDRAFYFCTKLTHVTIPHSMTSIRDNVFYQCWGLVSVTIAQSVNDVGSWVFRDCHSMTDVHFQGNAPSEGSGIFLSANNVTVYYLPGTTGWSATFGGRPTALWRPKMYDDDSFGVQSNQFGFDINWASGMTVVVEASTNLMSTNWMPLQTNTLMSDSLHFSDPQWTNHPDRFYRVRMP